MRKKTVDKNPFDWHEWFAWYPIWVNTGGFKGTWVFWEKVQRKRQCSYAGVDTLVRNLDGSPLE